MNITLERTESSKIKYELEKAIQFNNLLLKDVSCSLFLFDIIGSYQGIHLITLDHLITKYEKEREITVLQRRAIEQINIVPISMVIFKLNGFDNNIIKQWIAETEAELVELVKEIDKTEEE